MIKKLYVCCAKEEISSSVHTKRRFFTILMFGRQRCLSWLFRYINNFTVISSYPMPTFSHVYLLSCLIFFGRGIPVDLLPSLGNGFHILFTRILYHRIVFLRENLCHVIPADKCYHQCNGKNHHNVEQIGYYADQGQSSSFRNRLCFISLRFYGWNVCH